MRNVLLLVFAVSALLLCPAFVDAQSNQTNQSTQTNQASCLSPDEVKAMVAKVQSPANMTFNKKLRDELLKLTLKTETLLRGGIEQDLRDEGLNQRISETRDRNNLRLCQILKEFGWPTTALVGPEGVGATFFLLRSSRQLDLQSALLPVIVAAVKKGEANKSSMAQLIDRMRADAGMKQLFGTQVKVVGGFLVLLPIEAEAQVDERRKQFGLSPLAEHLRDLEHQYQTPLIREVAPSRPPPPALKHSIDRALAGEIKPVAVDADDIIRVNTNLVNLSVSVFNNQLKTLVGALDRKDFKVFENGHEESIEYFGTTDVPFDLVLLIDLSGSTADKRDLIRKSTQRFIAAARPGDRLGIVTFADTTQVICPLTADRAKLIESAKVIEGMGGTRLWDALELTMDQVMGPRTSERRRAIVIMSDGLDNALAGSNYGSETSFADLLESVRKSDELIIPIYLDTERDHEYISAFGKRLYENARKTLALLAQQSGGLYYQARKIQDLDGVYDQVINDLGKVYSLGYKPTNSNRDGSWRSVQITLPIHPDLSARARPGYYAN